MKRYRNLAVIAAVTTISLGVFYTKVATSESNRPVFYISTEQGETSAANNLEIQGNLFENNFNRSVDITTKGSEYKNDNSIFDVINRKTYSLEKLNTLQNEEKNFMRGKNNESNFYLDKDYVWYADVRGKNVNFEARNNDYKLYIDGLDLQSKDRFKFKVNIPNEEEYSYIGIEDVQLVGKELVVTTFQNKNYGENGRYIYRISINKKQMIDSKQITIDKDAEATIHTEYTNPSEIDFTKSKKYYVYKQVKMKTTNQEDGEVLSEELHSAMHIWNLETGKEDKLNLTKEQLEMSKQSELFQSDNMLYFISHNDQNVTVLKYSLERKKIEGEPTVISIESGVSFSGNKIIDGKLYTIANRENGEDRSIYIFDLATGKTIYEGAIKVKNTQENKEQLLKKLELYEFNVR
ncbi:hypothetical protein [Gottfriedia solisilvae]|uniref:hypothetical protein n=1 Tax=Gottfriedia solisilvae TaxID=1516104 RepID=UPI003D2EF1E9